MTKCHSAERGPHGRRAHNKLSTVARNKPWPLLLQYSSPPKPQDEEAACHGARSGKGSNNHLYKSAGRPITAPILHLFRHTPAQRRDAILQRYNAVVRSIPACQRQQAVRVLPGGAAPLRMLSASLPSAEAPRHIEPSMRSSPTEGDRLRNARLHNGVTRRASAHRRTTTMRLDRSAHRVWQARGRRGRNRNCTRAESRKQSRLKALLQVMLGATSLREAFASTSAWRRFARRTTAPRRGHRDGSHDEPELGRPTQGRCRGAAEADARIWHPPSA